MDELQVTLKNLQQASGNLQLASTNLPPISESLGKETKDEPVKPPLLRLHEANSVWALALANLFTPFHRWLESKLKRPSLAAADFAAHLPC